MVAHPRNAEVEQNALGSVHMCHFDGLQTVLGVYDGVTGQLQEQHNALTVSTLSSTTRIRACSLASSAAVADGRE